VSIWLADRPSIKSRPPVADPVAPVPRIRPYRSAVAELVAEIAQIDSSDGETAEHFIAKRLDEPQFADVLSATPDGRDATIATIMFDVRSFEPGPRSAHNLAALVRNSMLTQIDVVWWGRESSYETDLDVLHATELTDLDELSGAGEARFCYRHQAETLLSRAARSAERRTMPGRSPRTAGLRLAMTRPQVVIWLNRLADDFAREAPPGTPPLWVTSLTRSVEHQQQLRELGYLAPLPSAHCVGYAVDVAMAWYRRFHAHRILRGLLLDRQRAGEVNVIDEGQSWHVCLRPRIVSPPRTGS